MTPPKGFGLYRLHSGTYAGRRSGDVRRHDPNAPLCATDAPTAQVRDATAIKLFLVLLGGITYRSPDERLLDDIYRADAAHRNEPYETLGA